MYGLTCSSLRVRLLKGIIKATPADPTVENSETESGHKNTKLPKAGGPVMRRLEREDCHQDVQSPKTRS